MTVEIIGNISIINHCYVLFNGAGTIANSGRISKRQFLNFAQDRNARRKRIVIVSLLIFCFRFCTI